MIKKKLMGFNMKLTPFVPYAAKDIDRLGHIHVVCFCGEPCLAYTRERQAEEIASRYNRELPIWKRLLLMQYSVKKVTVFNYSDVLYVI